ncbi:hypothetical protein BH11PLA2_BH11PLA2_18840 [soil metagenome]
MRNCASKNWRNLRVTASRAKDSLPDQTPLRARGNLVAELPGPDGIRWGLVNRIKAEIAAGTYDTPDKLALAEAKILAQWDAA